MEGCSLFSYITVFASHGYCFAVASRDGHEPCHEHKFEFKKPQVCGSQTEVPAIISNKPQTSYQGWAGTRKMEICFHSWGHTNHEPSRTSSVCEFHLEDNFPSRVKSP